ncbi:LacI family DNA-binding transcriptional regulator [Agromyces albus]|uniref:LacI family DNA-binding transcriptional regulator n=1 Tax=Agromyces albus TaxID=205332 RepID=A0A4V1QWP1_9MICO|nr:LacI family DNA-binding transcriptional regulator [Agromyces albus]RXZ66836.1 LacI family DNA-binding transcriptional regulator [Agromyces albus]
MSGKRVGITDVAAAAGVSITTVSHALSGQGKVNDRTRQRVIDVAAELGYAPNRLASGLRSKRTGIIGLVSDEVATTPFAGRIVLGAQEAASDRGWLVVVVNSGGDRLIEQRQLASLLAQQVDAIVYATMSHRPSSLPTALRTIPTVLVNTHDESIDASWIVPDSFTIGTDATRHLIEHGHERIAHLTIAESGLGRDGRVAGYRAAMEEHGHSPIIVSTPEGATAVGGREAAEQLFERHPDVTAAFCFNDQMAMGLYQVAALRGVQVPDDLSVVGVDNLDLVAAALLPGLTTVALPHYEMGRWAIDQVARLLEHEDPPPAVHERYRCELIERDSVARPRG